MTLKEFKSKVAYFEDIRDTANFIMKATSNTKLNNKLFKIALKADEEILELAKAVLQETRG